MQESPITVISGARQVGKSTLMRTLLTDRSARIVNLDSTIDRNSALSDPDGFAAQFPEGTLAIDEIQRVPELLLSLKNALEADRRPGRYLLTGSSNLHSLRGAEESLAGRAQTVVLRGLSQGELAGRTEDFASYMWDLPRTGQLTDIDDLSRGDYLSLVTASTFPEIRDAPPRSRARWLGNYVERVLSKDVADASGIRHPERLLPLLQVIAAENASEFVAARFSRLLDVPERSIPAYIQALRNVFLIHELKPWSTNATTRAVSRPKLSIQDAGLAAFLCDIDADGLEHDISSTLTGGLVEGFVASELLKQQSWSLVDFTLRHYRDRNGKEVDLVLENRRREIIGLEVKATTSVGENHFRGLEYLREKAGPRFIAGAVLHTGTRAVPFGDRLWALPIGTLWRA